MSVECIVLDGWHKGHHVILPDVHQSLSLIRPEVITVDYCCDGEEFTRAPTNRHDYRLAFYSVDKKTALYSTDGSSRPITQRDWIVPDNKNHKSWIETPLYVGMHDPRSVTDNIMKSTKREYEK